MRRLPILAALLLMASAVPLGLSAFGQRWVIEDNGDTRVVMGPHQMVICEGDACRTVRYQARIVQLRARLAGPGLGAEERDRLESAVERLRYDRKKGRQIFIPALVAAGFFLAAGAALLLRGRGGLSTLTRSSVRFATCGIALGLVPFALVYVGGMSFLPAEGTRSQWGVSLYVLLLGALLALAGGVLAGVPAASRTRDEPAADPERPTD